jgi:hypothetical protein
MQFLIVILEFLFLLDFLKFLLRVVWYGSTQLRSSAKIKSLDLKQLGMLVQIIVGILGIFLSESAGFKNNSMCLKLSYCFILLSILCRCFETMRFSKKIVLSGLTMAIAFFFIGNFFYNNRSEISVMADPSNYYIALWFYICTFMAILQILSDFKCIPHTWFLLTILWLIIKHLYVLLPTDEVNGHKPNTLFLYFINTILFSVFVFFQVYLRIISEDFIIINNVSIFTKCNNIVK